MIVINNLKPAEYDDGLGTTKETRILFWEKFNLNAISVSIFFIVLKFVDDLEVDTVEKVLDPQTVINNLQI